MERSTAFSGRIKSECGFRELQGLCRNKQGEITIAVEAVDLEDDPAESFTKIIPEEEIFVKSCIAEKIGAKFTILLHKQVDGQDTVRVKQFVPDHALGKTETVFDEQMSEQDFLSWWKERKYGKQKKAYQDDMNMETNTRYFDLLFENNDTSWPSGVDGILTEKDGSGSVRVRALIENRIADKCKVKSYDPNRYFGRDYKSWVGSIKLARTLNVPLFLCTYSLRKGQEQYMGIGKIISADEDGLMFEKGERPDKNIFGSVGEVKDWIDKKICAP